MICMYSIARGSDVAAIDRGIHQADDKYKYLFLALFSLKVYRYRYLMSYAQSTVKGHIRVKQNVFLLPQITISDWLLYYTVHLWGLGEFGENEVELSR